MIELDDLYDYANENGIETEYRNMRYVPALSVVIDGEMCVVINPVMISSSADEKVKLAHEIGHCAAGGFYDKLSPWDVVARCENRANKWAIKKLVPKDELETAIKRGNMNLWELSEKFNVTEGFIKKAISFYRSGHL